MKNDDQFIIVHKWMVTDLGLTGNRAMIYAIIYGYSKDGDWFQGSASYLREMTGLSKKWIMKILQSLCDDGFLRRRERPYKGMKYVDYQTIPREVCSPGKKVHRGREVCSPDPGNKVPPKVYKKVKTKDNYARVRKWGDYSQRTDVDYDQIEKVLQSQISTRMDEDPDDIATR